MNDTSSSKDSQQGSSNKTLIDFQAVTVDPINAFYGKIGSWLPDLVDAYLSSLKGPSKKFAASQEDIESKIADNEQQVAERYTSDRIASRKTQNGFIFFAFFLLFLGFIWWKKYKLNKQIIAAFNKFVEQKSAENEQLRGKITYLSQTFFSTFTPEDAIESVARNIGLPFVNSATDWAIRTIGSAEPGFIDIKTAFTFIYKNTPFSDILYRTYAVRPVTTSASISVSYVVHTREGSFTETEVLTGYHTEQTPFIDTSHALLAPTNFKPNVDFWTQGKGGKHAPEFENREFMKKIRVDAIPDPETAQALFEFFTIKAQEDFVTWSTQWDSNAAQMFKRGWFINTLPRLNQPAQPFLLAEANNMFALHQAVSGAFTVTACEADLRNHLIAYFDDLLRRMQVPLLSPVINQEYWRPNGEYLISNFKQGERPEDVRLTNDYVMSRLFKAEFFSFLGAIPHKPCWFKVLSEKENDGFIERELSMHSFRGEDRIDRVYVSGVNVGRHAINVPYVAFFPIEERKRVAFILKPEPDIYANAKFAIGRRLIPHTFQGLFAGAFGQEAKTIGLWTNTPNVFANEARQELLRRAGELTDDNLALYRDEYGVYVIANYLPVPDPQNPETEQAMADFEVRWRHLKAIAREIYDLTW